MNTMKYPTAFHMDRLMAHYTLDASAPEAFRREMIDEFIPLFSSDKFNICCDETFDLGRGKTGLAAEIGEGKLYLYFVRELIEHLRSRKESHDVGRHVAPLSRDNRRNTQKRSDTNWDYAWMLMRTDSGRYRSRTETVCLSRLQAGTNC